MSAIALGWDVHRKLSQVSVQRREDNGEIRVIERIRLEHADREAMRSWLARLDAGAAVALEGAFGWQWIADLLAELGLEPHLGHPPAIKVLAKNEAKGDRCDADRLGRFYLKGIFPESYLATVEVRRLRQAVGELFGIGAAQRRLGGSSRAAGDQPVLQPQLALGLDRGGRHRFAQPPSAGTTATLI